MSAVHSPKRQTSKSPLGRRNAPETNVLELTPERGSKTKAIQRTSSPSRNARELEIIPVKVEKGATPTKGKLARSYDAPSSPGKSPKTGRGRSALVRSDSTDDEEKVQTPVTSPGGRKRISDAAVVSPTPSTTKSPSKPKSPLALHSNASKVKISPRVDKVYSIIRQCTGTLGGNGTTGAIYGELTMGSMQKIINLMIEKCELNNQSRFIDVGSGLGKPNFHAAQDPQCRLSVGVELEDIRWQLSMYNLKSTLPQTERGKSVGEILTTVDKDTPLLSGVNFMVGDIDDAASTDPFTHIYMYDLGFPPPLQRNIANKFNNSQYAQYLVSYRPPRRVIDEYGYDVEHIAQMTTSMHGSGENHMAYFYKRKSLIPKLTAEMRSNLKKVTFPARPGFDEKTTDILCDLSFESCVKMAVGDIEPLHKYATKVVETQLLSSDRPVRDRKPRRLFDT
jgi:hypothetical protein